jgi:hypothetical protein
MTSNLRSIAFVVFSAWACLAVQSARAQEPSFPRLYDQGVNAFFAGNSCRADALLSEALTFNSQDPRAYYFRALSLIRQGRIDEARGDMLVGARVEAQSTQRYAVGAALERVQGPARLMLEEFRCNARRDVAAPAATTTSAPAAQMTTPQERNSGVLREKRVVPLEELLRPGGPQTFVDEPAPLPPSKAASPADPPAAQPAEQPATPPQTPEENPFSDDSAPPPAAEPAPAVIPPQETPQATPPATPPAGPEENPFGG